MRIQIGGTHQNYTHIQSSSESTPPPPKKFNKNKIKYNPLCKLIIYYIAAIIYGEKLLYDEDGGGGIT